MAIQAQAPGRGGRDRLRAGPGPGPATRFRRSRAPVARAPHRASGNLLPRGQPGHRGPPARHTTRHGQITAALRAARAAPAAARGRQDRVLMNRRLLRAARPCGTGCRTASPVEVSRPARRLIGVMLVVAAALDLTRCGLVMVAVRRPRVGRRAGRGGPGRPSAGPECREATPRAPAVTPQLGRPRDSRPGTVRRRGRAIFLTIPVLRRHGRRWPDPDRCAGATAHDRGLHHPGCAAPAMRRGVE